MKVNECIKRVLALLDEVGASDYANRIHDHINKAQMTIATQWGFILKKKTFRVEEGLILPLPADVYAIEKVEPGDWDLEVMEEGGYGLKLSGSADGSYHVTYKAYPDAVTEKDSAKEIQLRPEYHAALCYLTAALSQDNEYDKRAYQLFKDAYDEQMGMILRARQQTNRAKVVVRR